MTGRAIWTTLFGAAVLTAAVSFLSPQAEAAGEGQPTDWHRFYYYPYIYYPQTFQQIQSYDHMYYRYGRNGQIPVYNKDWYNFYPTEKPYHRGNHFKLDIF